VSWSQYHVHVQDWGSGGIWVAELHDELCRKVHDVPALDDESQKLINLGDLVSAANRDGYRRRARS